MSSREIIDTTKTKILDTTAFIEHLRETGIHIPAGFRELVSVELRNRNPGIAELVLSFTGVDLVWANALAQSLYMEEVMLFARSRGAQGPHAVELSGYITDAERYDTI